MSVQESGLTSFVAQQVSTLQGEQPTKKRRAAKRVTYQTPVEVSDTDMKDNESIAFSQAQSLIAPSDTSSRKRKSRTATASASIKKRKSKTIESAEGLLSPRPSSPFMTITPTPTPGLRPVELESAKDKSSSSYISESNTGWIDMVTKE